MDAHLAEFLFAQLVLLLAVSLCGIVAWFLKRYVDSADEMGKRNDQKFEELGKRFTDLNISVARLLERDRMLRISDYKHTAPENEA